MARPIQGQWDRKRIYAFPGCKIEDFVYEQVTERGSDERTAMAYRLDLEHLYIWLLEQGKADLDEEAVEAYLKCLSQDKKRKASTIMRKYRVFCYYLEYLLARGQRGSYRPPQLPPAKSQEEKAGVILSKTEIDRFFHAFEREYESLDSGFRKRVCLRDDVMMRLLFYHGLEISELLRLELRDHDEKTGTLWIRGKRGKIRSVKLFSRVLREKLGQWHRIHGYFEREEAYRECMFLSKLGRPLSMKMVISIFDKYRVMAGIEKEATPKDLKCSMGRYAEELVMEQCS